MSGKEVIESSLHCELLEHINAEAGLGTFRTVDGAINWLKDTFLYVRMKQNPSYYQLEGKHSNVDETLEKLCRHDIQALVTRKLLREESEGFRITVYGEAMAKYYIRFETSNA